MFKCFEKTFIRYWWFIAFALFCFMLFEHGMEKRNREFSKLLKTKNALEDEKEKALATREKLLLQINSESDPAWIELVLMQGLGLVAEDYAKIFFPPSTSSSR